MLRTRLWMGTLLAGLTAGVLLLDQRFAPWYPFLLLFLLACAVLGCLELLRLLEADCRPPTFLCLTAVLAVVLANWLTPYVPSTGDPPALTAFVAAVLAVFSFEVLAYRGPGAAVTRAALAIWVVAYLGLLPSFLVRLRWLGEPDDPGRGTLALALAIAVPKCGDIGAYAAGRLFGRHPFAPTLSPKKTREGAVGGLLAAVAAAVAIVALSERPILTGGLRAAVGFGLSVGLAGMLGDLFESLVKREGQKKDASRAVPGFGGVLDVIDSVLFAAPVAYWWLR